MLKFNMGCGHSKLAGYVNVDAFAEAEPDEVWDLERTPWPWPDNSASEVRFIHSLEHMGGDPKVFLRMMSELYRICAPEAQVLIHVPHPRSDDFLNDPTHVRPITPAVLSLFDKQLCDEWKRVGASNSPFAHYLGVDFAIEQQVVFLMPRYLEALQTGAMSHEHMTLLLQERLNVANAIHITLRVRKGG